MTRIAGRFGGWLLVLAALMAICPTASLAQKSAVDCPPERSLQSIIFQTSKGDKRLAVPWSTITEIRRGVRRGADLVIGKWNFVALVISQDGSRPGSGDALPLQIALFPDSRIVLGKRQFLRSYDQPLNFWEYYSEEEVLNWLSREGKGSLFDLRQNVLETTMRNRVVPNPHCPECNVATPNQLYYLRFKWRNLERAILACFHGGCVLHAYASKTIRTRVSMPRQDTSLIPKKDALAVARAVDCFLATAAACAKPRP